MVFWCFPLRYSGLTLKRSENIRGDEAERQCNSHGRRGIDADLDVPHLERKAVGRAMHRQKARIRWSILRSRVGHPDFRSTLRTRTGGNILMMPCPSGNQVCIINCGVQRDRGGRPDILVAVVVDHVFQFVHLVAALIKNDMIMHGARSALKSNVRIKKEIPIMRRGDIALNECTRQWVAIAVC